MSPNQRTSVILPASTAAALSRALKKRSRRPQRFLSRGGEQWHGCMGYTRHVPRRAWATSGPPSRHAGHYVSVARMSPSIVVPPISRRNCWPTRSDSPRHPIMSPSNSRIVNSSVSSISRSTGCSLVTNPSPVSERICAGWSVFTRTTTLSRLLNTQRIYISSSVPCRDLCETVSFESRFELHLAVPREPHLFYVPDLNESYANPRDRGCRIHRRAPR